MKIRIWSGGKRLHDIGVARDPRNEGERRGGKPGPARES